MPQQYNNNNNTLHNKDIIALEHNTILVIQEIYHTGYPVCADILVRYNIQRIATVFDSNNRLTSASNATGTNTSRQHIDI